VSAATHKQHPPVTTKFRSLPAIKLLQVPRHCRRDRCPSGL